jgi:ABC-type uncharacterized transport system involved in gliding motility auxiliary subunit
MMKLHATLSFILLVVAFLLFTVLNNMMFSSARLDLTENNLYTLSDGTREIIEEIDEPINLYFFFSAKISEDLTALRAYAVRVQEMLEEYQLAAGSGINLQVIDPEPFSEAEDQAAQYGLQGVPVNQSGDELYFGLVGTNSLDGQEVISFFQPDREEFLEYELSKLIHNLSQTRRFRVGVFSSLEIDGGVNQTTFQRTEAWVFLDQLRELFDVEMLAALDRESLEPVDLLLLVHPKDLSEVQLFAVDQHVMAGKKLLAFIDPMAELDRPATPGMNMPGSSVSHLNALTGHWGLTLRETEILADSQAALMVGGAGGTPVRHLGILGMSAEQLSREDVVTASLESVNLSTAGILDVDVADGINAIPIITSSAMSSPLSTLQFQFLSDPADLQKGFTPTGEQYVTAVRLSGTAKTAFPDGVEGKDSDILRETDSLQVVLVADTDLLADRLWVQVQNFFGQQIASAFADNGSFVTNLVDNMSGSNALITVRSRGQFTRPFTVVEDLRRRAEAEYLQQAEDLQARLAETERQLSELEAARVDQGMLTLTPEQEDALAGFQDEKLRIRKELRNVRHQLDRDIESLGSMLKFLNIFLMPLVLTGLLVAMRVLRLHRGQGMA